MCHVDGIWHDGELLYALPSEYYGFGTGRPLSHTAGLPFGSMMLDPASERGVRMRRFVEQVIAALPSPDTFSFHAELWEGDDGEYCLNEIAARTGGYFVHSNAVTTIGAEPDAIWLALACGVDPHLIGYRGEADFQPSAGVALPYRSGLVRSVPAGCELDCVLDLDLRPQVKPGAVLPPQERWWDTLGDVTIVADTYAALPAARERVVKWAESAIRIDPGTVVPYRPALTAWTGSVPTGGTCAI
jgi:hypothetical protein